MLKESRQQRRITNQEVYVVHTLAALTRLWWSQTTITFDQRDRPDCVPHLGRYPLVVSPIMGTARLTKVLIDGGSGLTSSTPSPL
jgi:hypothetical protein